tara:strand:+ start:55 stop:447 length:393 start_codon:yes stop_codon:yes gene_type:complete
MVDTNKYNKAYQRWTKEEDEQLVYLYNIEKLTIGEICEKHKRFIGAIIARLKSKKIIEMYFDARGYKEFMNSESYNEMKQIKQKRKESLIKEELITITRLEYDELKKEIEKLKVAVSTIKNMIEDDVIYE